MVARMKNNFQVGDIVEFAEPTSMMYFTGLRGAKAIVVAVHEADRLPHCDILTTYPNREEPVMMNIPAVCLILVKK